MFARLERAAHGRAPGDGGPFPPFLLLIPIGHTGMVVPDPSPMLTLSDICRMGPSRPLTHERALNEHGANRVVLVCNCRQPARKT